MRISHKPISTAITTPSQNNTRRVRGLKLNNILLPRLETLARTCQRVGVPVHRVQWRRTAVSTTSRIVKSCSATIRSMVSSTSTERRVLNGKAISRDRGRPSRGAEVVWVVLSDCGRALVEATVDADRFGRWTGSRAVIAAMTGFSSVGGRAIKVSIGSTISSAAGRGPRRGNRGGRSGSSLMRAPCLRVLHRRPPREPLSGSCRTTRG